MLPLPSQSPVNSPNPIPVTGVRWCFGCQVLYCAADGQMTHGRPDKCPACSSEHTEHRESSPPVQKPLFDIPATPRPNAWAVEWRWKPHIQAALAAVIAAEVLPANDWVRHSAYNVTTTRTGINQTAKLRRDYPGKSWRLKPVSWHPTPLL